MKVADAAVAASAYCRFYCFSAAAAASETEAVVLNAANA